MLVALAAGVAVVAAALGAAADATARADDVVVARDAAGRAIRLDVRAAGVETAWYAALLRRAAHGDEIGTVTIRIVDPADLRAQCGARAGGCYRASGGGGSRGRGTVIVPAGRSAGVAHTLLHEYAHHIDRSVTHADAPEPNGTRYWWRTRGMEELAAERAVFRSYRPGGWSRSIAEIFAEDYARTQLDTYYAITWLSPPSAVVRQAILADLGLAAPPTATQSPAVRPVVIQRRGTLTAADRLTIPFGLLGPGRRVTFTVAVTGAPARLALDCGRRLGSKAVSPGGGSVTLDVQNVGPADRCRATLRSTSSRSLDYRATLRLAIER
jgi:hypothetical protein